ncbi:hypothetical protein ES703_20545 [subsurface metagenome]
MDIQKGGVRRKRSSEREPDVKWISDEGQVSLLSQLFKPKFIAEYDLPSDHRRKRFYRSIKKYLKEKGLKQVGWSTGSVVFTIDEDFAWYVYHEARNVGGTSHVYRAERLDEEEA